MHVAVSRHPLRMDVVNPNVRSPAPMKTNQSNRKPYHKPKLTCYGSLAHAKAVKAPVAKVQPPLADLAQATQSWLTPS